ncbi:MAG TPA: hypothetical protein VN226_09465 [Anaerolineales bacterium]|nr:hypothetical protein [Anaerolineales bacterium]
MTAILSGDKRAASRKAKTGLRKGICPWVDIDLMTGGLFSPVTLSEI